LSSAPGRAASVALFSGKIRQKSCGHRESARRSAGCAPNWNHSQQDHARSGAALSGFYYQNFYGANYHVKDVVTMADLNYRVQRVIESEVAVIQRSIATEWRRGDVRHGKFSGRAPGTGGKRQRTERESKARIS